MHELSPRQYRTIWISDVHLGTHGCKADFLLDFLRCTEARTIYLVGDIVDGLAAAQIVVLAANPQ
jgi:UDP-2,3-diacylglucosamine pyrophosphatase LpxH